MKILIIGLGSIGKKHLQSTQSIFPDAEFFAFRFNKNAEQINGVINVFDFNDLVSIQIDFAIISNPTSEHKKTILQLVPFGFPLFIEKPVYYNLDLNDVIEFVNKNSILTYVACNLRFLDCLIYIKNTLSRLVGKKINEVNIYCGSYLPDWRPGTDYRKIYSASAGLGGGVHLDLIHELDYIYWLFGYPNSVKSHLKNTSSLEISSYDYANYLLDYNGFCASVVLNYYRRDPRRTLEIIFEDETWNVDLLKNCITCNNNIIFSSEQRIKDTYLPQMKYFTQCVINKENTFNSVSDAFNVLKICLVQ